ncbi:MAG: hypothetical protein ACP5O7_12855, partial [Phycisphaerae bacterium]
GVPRVEGGLHAQPHLRALPEGRAETDHDLGRDRLALAQDVFAQQRTGMGRTAVRIPFCNDFAIAVLQLMVCKLSITHFL